MRYIIIQILKRLYSGEGKPVLVLTTEFGGGKTHTLLLVYHVLKDKVKGLEYLKHYEIDKELAITDLPDVYLVSIDCRRLLGKITLWGEIARQLNMYNKVKKYDQEKLPPNVDILTELFSDKPVLLLIDEFYNYVFDAQEKVGNKTLGDYKLHTKSYGSYF
jgi:predicted AAA+ superfamily ATPase